MDVLSEGGTCWYWSRAALADHRADARAWVRALLGVSDGHDQVDPVDAQPGTPAPVVWELARPDDPDLQPLQRRLLRAISQRIQWRAQLRTARERTGPAPPRDVSATTLPDATRTETPQ